MPDGEIENVREIADQLEAAERENVALQHALAEQRANVSLLVRAEQQAQERNVSLMLALRHAEERIAALEKEGTYWKDRAKGFADELAEQEKRAEELILARRQAEERIAELTSEMALWKSLAQHQSAYARDIQYFADQIKALAIDLKVPKEYSLEPHDDIPF